MNGLGGAAGVLLGGIITEVLSWRWVLLINPPIAIAATLVAFAVVTERRRAPGASFDLAGALTLTIGQMVLVYGVVEAGLKGWGTFAALGPIALGLVLLGAFGVIETRVASAPLIPFKQLTKGLRTANTVVLLFSAALFPMWFVSSLYMQQVLGLSPLHTGLVFLPMTLTIMLIARQAGKLVGRFGVRTVLGSGLLMLTGGLLLFTRIGSSGSPIVYVIIPGVLTAAGIAMAIVPSTIAATQGAKEGQAGLASGLVNTSRQIGGGLGLALLITLATQRTTHLIGSGQQVSQALTHGFALAYLIGAGLAASAAILTFTSLPKPPAALRGAARRFAFAIAAVLASFVALTAAFAGSHGAPLGAYTTRGAYSYVTEPGLHPPKIHATYHAPASALAPGYIFTANFYDLNEPPIVGQSGPLILDRNLQPVWFQPVSEKVVASNLSLQTYEGKPALAWWQGRVTNTGATETGEDVVVNSHYQKIASLKATGGWVLTLHELLISGERRVGDRQQEHPDGPLQVRRRLQRRAGRLGRAGVQPEDRQAVAQLGRARPHPAERVPGDAADQRVPLGRIPRQRDRPDRQRRLRRLDARHVGRLHGRHRQRQDRVDARRQELELQVRPRRRLQMAARRRAQGRLDRQPVRRPLLPADRRRHLRLAKRSLARARAEARRTDAHRDARQRIQPRQGLRRGVHGRHPAASERQRARRLGLGTVLLRVQPLRQAAGRRGTAGIGPHLQGDARAMAGPAAHATRRRGAHDGRRQDDRVRELERRYRSRFVAGPRRPRGREQRRERRRRPTDRGGHRRQDRLRDRDLRGAERCAERGELRGAGARRPRPGALRLASLLRGEQMTMRAAMLPAALALSVGLCACGGASASSEVLHAEELHAEVAATAAAANPVTVSPLPDTEDASPETQIAFLGRAGTRVADVRVVGSRSGVHGGQLQGYSTGTGESFLPTHPFVPGERVTVHARVSASPGAAPTLAASTTFTIAHQASISTKEFPIQKGEASAVQHYSSAPTLTPSTVTVTTPAKPGATPGDLFLAPYQGEGTPGPMITDQGGNLVWFHPLPSGIESTNFSVQQYEGKPVLAWWQGRILEVGFGQGEQVLYNTAYRQVATIRAGNGYRSDLHEIRLTPEGTAWIDVFDPVDMNLKVEGGSANDILTDSVIEEVDVKTGLVMWEWHALGHIPIGESNQPVPANNYPWDYVHINSIDPGPTGDVLLSSRNTWALYDVDLHSGGFHWRIGGKRSTFKLGPGTRFYWQHDAEFQPGGLISVFDNGSNPPKEKQSRGLLLALDPKTRTVTLAKRFFNPAKTLLASSQGNVVNLSAPGQAGGNWLMGYGGLPNLTEYNFAGEVLLDATLGKNVQDFRTYLSPWSGQPTTPPSVVAQPGAAGALTVAVSWNGATEVASWQVLAGASPSTLEPVATAPKSGFQTTIATPSPGPYVAVQALNSAGAVIGTSAAVKA